MTRRLPVFVVIAALLCPAPAAAQMYAGASARASAPAIVLPSSSAGSVPSLTFMPSLAAASVPLPLLAPAAVLAAAPAAAAVTAPAAASAGAPAVAALAAAAAPASPSPAGPAEAPAAQPRSTEEASAAGRAAFDGEADLPPLTPRQHVVQRVARLKLLVQRAATFPAHAWPFSALAKKISHGEALAGLSPASAVDVARRVRSAHGTGTVVGRLSWELHDVWSVRGAVKSYLRLVDSIARAKARDPKLDVAVSLDVESLGAELDGFTPERRLGVATANAELIARRAKEAGVPVEFDIGGSAMMPIQFAVAESVARSVGTPVRLAVAARYLASGPALRKWAALARATGLKLGVRLVKGSFIEGDKPGAINVRRALLDQYKKLITEALSLGGSLDVAVATQNEEIWEHAKSEARRLHARFTVNTIRGVNAPLQERMRVARRIEREYVSYGIDTPVMALMEMWTNWRQRRALAKREKGEID